MMSMFNGLNVLNANELHTLQWLKWWISCYVSIRSGVGRGAGEGRGEGGQAHGNQVSFSASDLFQGNFLCPVPAGLRVAVSPPCTYPSSHRALLSFTDWDSMSLMNQHIFAWVIHRIHVRHSVPSPPVVLFIWGGGVTKTRALLTCGGVLTQLGSGKARGSQYAVSGHSKPSVLFTSESGKVETGE